MDIAMEKTLAALATVVTLGFLVSVDVSFAGSCVYDLRPASDQRGRARVTINNTRLIITFRGAKPNRLYTVWIDYRKRATLQLASDYPLQQGALPRGVAPAFATTAGVTSGMGLDPNAIITDHRGNATLDVFLDYDLLEPGDSPVVGEELAMQGENRVGGAWLRVYPKNPKAQASLQVTDPEDRTLPLVERSTVQGITIVRHPDFVSHGHTPGVGGVDHFPAFSGDFPPECPLPDISRCCRGDGAGLCPESGLSGAEAAPQPTRVYQR